MMKCGFRLISVLLCLTIVFGSVTLVANADTGSENVRITITTNKSSYSAGETAKVTVQVENVGSSTLSGVAIAAKADNWLLAKGSNSNVAEIGMLTPGSSGEMTFSAVINRRANGLGFFAKLILFFRQLFSRPTPFQSYQYSGKSTADTSLNVQHGGADVRITAVCCYTVEEQQDDGSNIVFNDFYTDKIDVLVNTTEPVTFKAEITALKKPSVLRVFDEAGNAVGNLYDDGAHHDNESNDGLYANVFNVTGSERGIRRYYADYSGTSSKMTEISIYRNFTEQEKTAHADVIDGIRAIRLQYLPTEDVEENVERFQNCLRELNAYLTEQKRIGKIIDFTEGDTEIDVTLLGDIHLSIFYEDLLFVEDDAEVENGASQMPARKAAKMPAESSGPIVNKKIVTLFPINTFPPGIISSAHLVQDIFPEYEYSDSYVNWAANLDQFKKLYQYSIVFIFTHGSESEILTGERYDWYEDFYDADLQAGRIRITLNDGQLKYTITKKFFSDCFKGEHRLNHTLFYIGACSVAGGDIPETILRAGAEAVYCIKHSCFYLYINDMASNIFKHLCEGATTGTALKLAKNECGDVDPQGDFWASRALALLEVNIDSFLNAGEFQLFGNQQFRLSDKDYIPDDAVEFQGHRYKLYSSGTVSTWEGAELFCESMGGYLAVISSAEENEFLFNYITSQGIHSAYFGFSDFEEEGSWKWIVDEGSSFTHWHPGEPNSDNSREDYAMFYWRFQDGTWNDGNYLSDAFICEWGDISDTGVVTD